MTEQPDEQPTAKSSLTIITPGGSLERALRATGAIGDHPAGRRRVRGMQLVEVAAARDVAVYGLVNGRTMTVGQVTIPAVHMLECQRCGTPFRIGSPFVATHFDKCKGE
jgi:hypothetical protein